MKKYLATTMSAITFSLVLQAQEIPERKTDPPQSVNKEKLVDKKERASLNLSNEQEERLKSINQDMRQQVESLRQQHLADKEYQEKLQALRQEQHAKFESILTPEQKTELEKYKEARK